MKQYHNNMLERKSFIKEKNKKIKNQSNEMAVGV